MKHSPLGDEDQHIETTSHERLIRMANDIANFFAIQTHDVAVEGVRNHIAKFWDPRMRQQIRDHLAAGGQGLSPLAREAVAALVR